MFSGCGGFSLAFEQAGNQVQYAVERDECACETYRKQFPHAQVYNMDANQFVDTWSVVFHIRDKLLRRESKRSLVIKRSTSVEQIISIAKQNEEFVYTLQMKEQDIISIAQLPANQVPFITAKLYSEYLATLGKFPNNIDILVAGPPCQVQLLALLTPQWLGLFSQEYHGQ